MKNVANYKQFVNEQVQAMAGASLKDTMDAYQNDPQARSNINGAIQANASYNSVFTAIKNYWKNQIPLLKAKTSDQMTDAENSMMDTIESNFKNGDDKSIEEYAIKKVLGGHSKEVTYQKDQKKLIISGYTETPYDKSIKSK